MGGGGQNQAAKSLLNLTNVTQSFASTVGLSNIGSSLCSCHSPFLFQNGGQGLLGEVGGSPSRRRVGHIHLAPRAMALSFVELSVALFIVTEPCKQFRKVTELFRVAAEPCIHEGSTTSETKGLGPKWPDTPNQGHFKFNMSESGTHQASVWLSKGDFTTDLKPTKLPGNLFASTST